VQHRLPSTASRLGLATVLALVAGFAAAAAAKTIGLAIHARTALIAVPTAAAFPVFFGFTLVMLGVLIFRPPGGSQVAGAAPPAARGAPALKHAASMPAAGIPARRAPSRMHRRVFWVLIGIYGTALLAWPLMSFGAIFAFDDPNANKLLVWYIAASIWLYPAYVMVGFLWGYFNRSPSLFIMMLKTSVPLLSAIWFFLLPGVPVLLRAWLTEPGLEEVVRQREEIHARLDPIYAERAIAVRARDAEADAREAIRRGDVALLPYTPGRDDYIGIEGPPPLDAASSQRVIDQSEYLTGIVTLLTEDSTHPRSPFDNRASYDYAVYFSDIFRDFLDARREYMARFNTVIAQHLKALR
jgi:hypothetical protein